jgi:hypothetical protein
MSGDIMSRDIFEERHFVGDIMSRDIFAAILCRATLFLVFRTKIFVSKSVHLFDSHFGEQ